MENEGVKCCYPNCSSCKLEYCTKDDEKKIKKTVNRKEYFKKYYKENKENYNAQTQYVQWVELKKTITRLKRKIGTNNYDLIIDELEKLDRKKYGK